MVAVVAGAAPADADLAELLARLHAHRRENLTTLIDALARNGPLRVDRDNAIDAVWALTSPEVHQLTRRVRGWSAERYQAWLADTLASLLLASGQ